MGNWVIVYSADKEYKAEIVKTILEEQGIVTQSVNKIDSLYMFGEIEIYVLPENVILAKHIIRNNTDL